LSEKAKKDSQDQIQQLLEKISCYDKTVKLMTEQNNDLKAVIGEQSCSIEQNSQDLQS